jgi:hypothetical protein
MSALIRAEAQHIIVTRTQSGLKALKRQLRERPGDEQLKRRIAERERFLERIKRS